MFIVITELFIFMDIVLNFFVSYRNDGDQHPEKDFNKISKRYLFGKFKKDLLVFLPLGLIGEIEGLGFLRLFWLLKLLRLGNV
jgi:hypothetical protein